MACVLAVLSALVAAAVGVATCSATVPNGPTLLYPPNDSTGFVVRDVLSWQPAVFDATCTFAASSDFDGWTYTVLLQGGAAPSGNIISNATNIAPQGSNIPWGQPFYVTKSLAEGTVYYWQVIAYDLNSNFAYSPVWNFTVAGSTSNYVTPIQNGVAIIDAMYSGVIPTSYGFKYYALNITTPGGSVVVTASVNSLPIPSPPPTGHVDVFLSMTNSFPSTPSMSDAYSAGVCATGTCAVAVPRQVASIAKVTSNTVYIGIRAVAGFATYTVTAVYSCPNGGVLATAISTQCGACPSNAVASTTGVLTCECARGFYAPNNNITAGCSSCPTGGICDGVNAPIARVGYWSASSSAGVSFYRCSNKYACLGGPDSRCATGYTGRLCSACATGYYDIGVNCYACPNGFQSPASNAQFAIGVILLVFFLFLCYELARLFRKLSSLTVIISWAQTLAILPLYNQLNWPQYINVFFNDNSGFNLNIQLAGPECIVETTWVNVWMYSLFLPLVVFGIFGLAFLAQLLIRCCQKREHRWTIRDIVNKCIPAYITFLIFFYIQVTYAALEYFNCTPQPDGSFTLDASGNITCYTDQWFKYLGIAIYGIFVWGVGIPAGLLIWLVIRKHKLYDVSKKGDEMYKWLGPIYLRFKAEFYFWEFINFLRKAGILAVGAFLNAYAQFSACLAIAILGFAIVLVSAFRPYRFTPSNFLEILLNFVLILLFLAGTLFESGSLPVSNAYATTVFALLVIILAVGFVFSAFVFFWELRETAMLVSEEDLEVMREKLAPHEVQHTHTQAVLHHNRIVPNLPSNAQSGTFDEDATGDVDQSFGVDDDEDDDDTTADTS